MTDSEGPFLAGRLLIAAPNIGDPRFRRSVILMCAHDEEHAMGIAVNQPVRELTVASILRRTVKRDFEGEGIVLPDDLVLMGGPVETNRGFVLHSDDYAASSSSVRVAPGINLTGTPDVLEALAGHDNRPKRSLVAFGYAGWGPGQLEQEILGATWLVCDADADLVFNADHELKWSRALAKIGVSPSRFSGQAGTA
jgi:putative transcriptional regulator